MACRDNKLPKSQLFLPISSLKEALAAANKSDAIVAVLGEPSAWSGEASSLSDIGIQKVQQNLLKALLKTGKPVVLVLVNGRPMTLGWENENVSAIVETWALGYRSWKCNCECSVPAIIILRESLLLHFL